MGRDSMVHMRKHYRHLIKNTPSHGAVWNEYKWKIPSEASMRTQCMGRHVQGQPRWQQTTCAAPHVYTRDTLLGSPQAADRPFIQCVPVSCGCVCASPVASWFAALCVHRGIACGPVPVRFPFRSRSMCCERLTFGNETLGTGSGTCSRSRSVPVFFKGTTNTA